VSVPARSRPGSLVAIAARHRGACVIPIFCLKMPLSKAPPPHRATVSPSDGELALDPNLSAPKRFTIKSKIKRKRRAAPLE